MSQNQEELFHFESSFNVNEDADDIGLEDLLALLADDITHDSQDMRSTSFLGGTTQSNENSMEMTTFLSKESKHKNKSNKDGTSVAYQTLSQEQTHVSDQNVFDITFFQLNNERYYKNMYKMIKIRHESRRCCSYICPFCRVLSYRPKEATESSTVDGQPERSTNLLQNENLSFIPLESSKVPMVNSKKRDPVTIARSERAKKMKRTGGMFSKSSNDEMSNSS